MHVNRIRVMEHLAVDCCFSLTEVCEGLQQLLSLPDFAYDCENETEWSSVVDRGIEYNVSRPYKRGTLEEWDDSVPAGCSVAVTLTAFKDCPPGQDPEWDSTELVERVGQGLANLLEQTVYHHRTWLRPGENITREQVFQPK
ncbi:hypothetical protein NG895_04465 [Aeoliella sp. ICT_H6.2]|uniref:Uncharacterized protein n=1 Tax=Aeoliella straminimaris TaxID=2954799 RepID=A0A9X2F7A9_9BACT|nr:hypothetical protein [Aeoliella straminimaris]MCO6043149.1 hypothetical protein [Aeoliella straminimaris]